MIRFLIFITFFAVFVYSESCMDLIITCPDMKNVCSETMVQNECPYTCGICTQDPTKCSDTNLDCTKFNIQCEFDNFKKFVVDYCNFKKKHYRFFARSCPQTCGTCGSTTQSSCVDHSVNCPNYSNQCISDYLKELCPLSCNTCNTTTTTVSITTVTRGVRTTVIPIKTTVSTTTTTTTVPTVKTTKTTTTVPPQTTNTTKRIPTTPKTPCKDASPNCGAWAKNGFCTNTFYPPEKRKEYCAKTCKFC
ncbi:hypothetical protein CRE_05233 [Caenorhabditis remanei]|uniref:ShKT domain-containing protein n=1 Tax=Caenorhabditis remanei TaxID=31234 RepID=E3NGT9_CAERE|nr:hypothetical protein CRE_05233 [Caenorhabditis remanei]